MSEIPTGYQPEQSFLSYEFEPHDSGKLLVITGPSGAGKDTLVNNLLNIPELGYERIVTYTSRKQRPNEIEGIDYHFISEEDFLQKKQEKFFAEDADVGGLKGTARKPFEEVLHEGKKYIWRIDPFRAATIEETLYKKEFPDVSDDLMKKTQIIYIGVNRLTVLKDRFINRDREQYNKDDLLKRLREDWKVWNMYQERFKSGSPFHTVINDKSEEEMTDQVLEIITNS